MKKRILSLLLAAALVLTFAGCSGGTAGGTGNEGGGGVSYVGNAGDVGYDVSIVEGEKRMTDGLKFDGKTFKLAFPYPPFDYTKRKIADFEKAFDCKLDLTVMDWYQINMDLAAAKASGAPADLMFYSGDFYPSTIIQDLLQPLDGYYTTADMLDPNKPELGGLSNDITKSFNWDNKSYVAASHQSVYPEVMYYNKLLFRDSGLEDPMDLYKKGEWTWDNLMKMAHEFTDPANGTYFLGGFGNVSVWLAYNNINPVVFDNGVPRQNLQDQKLIEVMNGYKNLYNGADAISYNGPDDDELGLFIKGKSFVYIEVMDAYGLHYDKAAASNAFARDGKNMGAIPLPSISTNPNNLMTFRTPQGWAAGAGTTDPRVAVAFAMFESTWVDTQPAENAVPADIKKLFDERMYRGVFVNVMGFQDNNGLNAIGSVNKDNTNRGFGDKIKMGADVISTLNEYQNAVQKSIVDSTTK